MTNLCAGTGEKWDPLTGEWYGRCPGCTACRETESDAEAEARDLAESEREAQAEDAWDARREVSRER